MTGYSRRELRQATREALEKRITGPGDPEVRARAEAALAQLDCQPGTPGEDPREPCVYRVRLQPGLWLLVDASPNILLEVRSPDEAELLAVCILGNVGAIAEELLNCRIYQAAAVDDAESARMTHLTDVMALRRLSEPREGEDGPSRARTVTELTTAGLDARGVAYVLRRAYGHCSATFNVDGTDQLGTVTYDRETGRYAVRVPAGRTLPKSLGTARPGCAT